MKKLLILFTLTLFVNFIFAQSPSDTLSTFFSSLNLANFENKPVDSFIAKIPTGYTSIKVSGGWRTEIADNLTIIYPNDVVVFVYVFQFTHMNPHNPNKQQPDLIWDVANFRKENVSYIQIWKDILCLNGCQHR